MPVYKIEIVEIQKKNVVCQPLTDFTSRSMRMAVAITAFPAKLRTTLRPGQQFLYDSNEDEVIAIEVQA